MTQLLVAAARASDHDRMSTRTAAGPGVAARSAPSRYMRLVSAVLASEPKLMADREAFRAAHQPRSYPRPEPPPASLRSLATVVERPVAGRAAYVVTPRRGGEHGVAAEPWHLVYLHGGGYVNALFGVHWEIIRALILATGATIWVPDYPLAPEHDHRAGNDYVEAFYRELIEDVPAGRVVLCGDSAGGGLALAQAMRYRDAGLAMPARLVLFSPCTCVVPCNPEVEAIEPLDVILARPGGALAGEWWAGPDDTTHPQVSPLYGDLSGLPPVDVYQGTADILAPDVRLTVAKIAAAGGEARLEEYPGAIHVFVGATFTPEARDAFARVGATLGAAPLPPGGLARFVDAPEVVLTRQALIRLHARGTPWIRHVGLSAHVRLITLADDSRRLRRLAGRDQRRR